MAAETIGGEVLAKPAVTIVKFPLIVARVSLGAPSMSPTRSLEMTTPPFKTVAHGNQKIVCSIAYLPVHFFLVVTITSDKVDDSKYRFLVTMSDTTCGMKDRQARFAVVISRTPRMSPSRFDLRAT